MQFLFHCFLRYFYGAFLNLGSYDRDNSRKSCSRTASSGQVRFIHSFMRRCQMKSVEVLFFRHAETEQNIRVQHFCQAIQRLKNLKLPSWKQITRSLQLLELDLDAEISSLGHRQLVDMEATLKEDKAIIST